MKNRTQNVENEIIDEDFKETKIQKKKSKKVKIIIGIIIAVFVLVLAYVIGSGVQKFSQNMQDQKNDGEEDGTYTVDKQNVEQEITTSGTIVGIEKRHIHLRLRQKWRIFVWRLARR